MFYYERRFMDSKNYPLSVQRRTFEEMLKDGYVYDCERGKYQIYRHKYSGREQMVPKDLIEKFESADRYAQENLEQECTNPNQ